MRLVVGLLILRFAFSAYMPIDKDEVISWQEGRRLSWSDFKGVPERRNSVASTYYDINQSLSDYHNYASVEIEAVFFPRRSWKRKDRDDISILTHEQKHFDITELFARRLRKKIQSASYSNYRELEDYMNKCYKENDEAMEIFQTAYDDETDHSRNGVKQGEWNQKIEKELRELSDYKEKSFTIDYR